MQRLTESNFSLSQGTSPRHISPSSQEWQINTRHSGRGPGRIPWLYLHGRVHLLLVLLPPLTTWHPAPVALHAHASGPSHVIAGAHAAHLPVWALRGIHVAWHVHVEIRWCCNPKEGEGFNVSLRSAGSTYTARNDNPEKGSWHHCGTTTERHSKP